MEKVFVYGTLLHSEIQQQLFGREIFPVARATLRGWKKMTDKEYPYLIADALSVTQGSIIELSAEELAAADRWEEVPFSYKRLKLPVGADPEKVVHVWVYVSADANS